MSIQARLGQALQTIYDRSLEGNDAITLLDKENAYIKGAFEYGYNDHDGKVSQQMIMNDKAKARFMDKLNSQKNNINGGNVDMIKFIPAKPKTFKESLSIACASLNRERFMLTVRCIDGIANVYNSFSYKTRAALVDAIMSDFFGCKYTTAKVFNDELTIILSRDNAGNSELEMHEDGEEVDCPDDGTLIGIVESALNPVNGAYTSDTFRKLISTAFDRHFSFLTIDVDGVDNTYEIKKFRGNNFAELVGICSKLIGSAEYVLTDDSCSEEIVVKFENKNNINEGDVNMKNYQTMTKSELREVLATNGVVLSNVVFKSTKRDELIARINALGEVPVVVEETVETQTQFEDTTTVQFTVPVGVLPVEAPKFSIESLAALLAQSMTLDVRSAVEDSVVSTVVPAVETIVNDANSKVLAELKAQLDTMNATISGLANGSIRTQAPTQQPRANVGVCEECGAGITNPNVVNYSKANCGGHVYCYTHQQSHKVARQYSAPANNGNNYSFSNHGANQTQQQTPSTTPQQNVGVIIKPCMCCGNDTKYINEAALIASTTKAQGLGLKAIICKKCATKQLAERATQQQSPATNGTQQMPGSGFVPSSNPTGAIFNPNQPAF